MTKPQNHRNIYLIISIDTEEEMEWGKGFKRHVECTVNNIRYLEPLHRLAQKYGIILTYLIDYPVVRNREAVAILKRYRNEGLAEIGAHLHPWCNPPYDEELTIENTFVHNLPEELQFRKMQVLTQEIAENFGHAPCSYRAGRYGFSEAFIPILESLHFAVDSSVVPFRLANKPYEPNFGVLETEKPYFLNYRDMTRMGNSGILEVPITIGFTRPVPGFVEKKYIYFPDWGIRKMVRFFFRTNLVWLRPSYATLEEMKQLTLTRVRRGVRVLNMMFHSNELMPGGSKYNRTAEDVEQYLRKLEEYFRFLFEQFPVQPIGLGELEVLKKVAL